MKIVHITPCFHPSIGGIEEVVLQLCIHSQALGHEVSVIHIATGIDVLKTDFVRGIRVLRVPVNGTRFVGLVRDLEKHIGTAEVCHVHDPQLSTITLNLFLGRKSTVKYVLSTHGGFMHTQRYALLKSVYLRVFVPILARRYRLILATSKSDYKLFAPHVKVPMAIVENGVDCARFRATPSNNRERGLSRWLYWGRLSKNKQLSSALKAVACVKRLGYQVKFTIAGRDIDNVLENLKEEVLSLGLEDQVSFVGELSSTQLSELVSESDVYMNPSTYEGFGIGFIEAMAAGLFVVGRDMYPTNAFLKHKITGFHFDFDDEESISESVESLFALSSDELCRIRRQAQDLAMSYDWTRRIESFLHHYREVSSGNLYSSDS